jgi:hypothetical protein
VDTTKHLRYEAPGLRCGDSCPRTTTCAAAIRPPAPPGGALIGGERVIVPFGRKCFQCAHQYVSLFAQNERPAPTSPTRSPKRDSPLASSFRRPARTAPSPPTAPQGAGRKRPSRLAVSAAPSLTPKVWQMKPTAHERRWRRSTRTPYRPAQPHPLSPGPTSGTPVTFELSADGFRRRP